MIALVPAMTALPPADLAALDEAAREYLAAKGRLMGALERAGSVLQSGLHRLPGDAQRLVAERARDALELAYRVSVTGLGRDGPPSARAWQYRAAGMASGLLGGAGGFATTLVELPVTTALILRSIAEVARAAGHDPDDAEVRAHCIEVFAFGGPLEEDDDADLAFWGARLAGREVAGLLVSVAARYAPQVLTKLAAQAAPVLGGVVGAGLNLLYMQFYQAMARVVFRLLPLEREHGRAPVRAAFAHQVRAVAARRDSRSSPRGDSRFSTRGDSRFSTRGDSRFSPGGDGRFNAPR